VDEKIAHKYVVNAVMYQKWMHIWLRFEKQIMDLPMWAQETLLNDIQTTVQNRVLVMQKTRSMNESNTISPLQITVFEYSRTLEQHKHRNYPT
jgi:hypothetical protein